MDNEKLDKLYTSICKVWKLEKSDAETIEALILAAHSIGALDTIESFSSKVAVQEFTANREKLVASHKLVKAKV